MRAANRCIIEGITYRMDRVHLTGDIRFYARYCMPERTLCPISLIAAIGYTYPLVPTFGYLGRDVHVCNQSEGQYASTNTDLR